MTMSTYLSLRGVLAREHSVGKPPSLVHSCSISLHVIYAVILHGWHDTVEYIRIRFVTVRARGAAALYHAVRVH